MECFICQEEIFSVHPTNETTDTCSFQVKCKDNSKSIDNDTMLVDENMLEISNMQDALIQSKGKGKVKGQSKEMNVDHSTHTTCELSIGQREIPLVTHQSSESNEFEFGFGKMKCSHVFHDICIFYEFVEQIKNCPNVLYCPYCKVTQSKTFFENVVQYLELKDTPFHFKKMPKTLNFSFDKELCCVYNPLEMRQCKRKYKRDMKKPIRDMKKPIKKIDNEYEKCDAFMKKNELDSDQLFKYNICHVYNNYSFLKTNMCTFHQNHESVVKGIIHPIYKILYTKCVDS